MKVWIKGQGVVELSGREFVGRGGQGAIYAKGSTAFKIFDNKRGMVPLGKIQELAAIVDDRIIKPENVVCDHADTPIGYTMRYIPEAHALCRIFPKAFRERHGIAADRIGDLVGQLRDGVAHVHAAGALVVDLNEMNFLLSKDFDKLFFIDVDAYQTRRYPADALMESVRDRHAPPNRFSESTDWFSFAVVSFQMFLGIHPYKGKHPTVKGLDARMKANISVLNAEVRVPDCVYPIDVIPSAFRAWYEAVFEKGRRCPPPSEVGAAPVVVPTAQTLIDGKALKILKIAEVDRPILGTWVLDHQLVITTDRAIWLNRRRIADLGADVRAVGFSPRMSKVVAATIDAPHLYDLSGRHPIPFETTGQQIASYADRIYIKSGGRILEIVLTDVGDQVVASPRIAAQVSAHATQLFSGVAVQSLLGATFVSLFPRPGESFQHHLRELDPYSVISASFDTNVLMVVGEKQGRYDRLIFRFDNGYAEYDMRYVQDAPLMDLNFVVLDTGVCVCLNEDEKLEVFGAQTGSDAVKIIDDPYLTGDMRLSKRHGELLFSRGNTLYRLTMR